MIVVLTATEPARLTDLDRFDRLHAELHGDPQTARLEPLCARHDDDDHVWLDVAASRMMGSAASEEPTFAERFDAMIAYAERSGWLNEGGTHVRAHVERAD